MVLGQLARCLVLALVFTCFCEKPSARADDLDNCQPAVLLSVGPRNSVTRDAVMRAIDACTAIIKSVGEPRWKNALAFFSRGSAYSNLGKHDRAISDLTKALKLGLDDAKLSSLAYYYLSNAYSGQGNYDRAIALLNRAIKLDPVATNYMARDDAYKASGDIDKATADFRAAERLLPQDHPLRKELVSRIPMASLPEGFEVDEPSQDSTPPLPDENAPRSPEVLASVRSEEAPPSLEVAFWTSKGTIDSLELSFANQHYTVDDVRQLVSIRSPDKKLVSVHMTLAGPIDKRMLEMAKVFSELNQAIVSDGMPLVSVQSDGGSVAVGLEIGRILFDRGATVIVNGDCMSSCLFLYAGAHSRMIAQGRIGIHRPFSNEAIGDLTRAKYRELMSPVFSSVAAFLEEMGVSADVLEMMKSIPSSQMRFLTSEELDRWGLGYDNVVAKELERNKILMRCGEDYVNRYYTAEQQVKLQCDDPDKYAACSKKVESSYGVEDGRRCTRLRIERKCGEAFAVDLYSTIASVKDCKTEECRKTLREKAKAMFAKCSVEDISAKDY